MELDVELATQLSVELALELITQLAVELSAELGMELAVLRDVPPGTGHGAKVTVPHSGHEKHSN